MTNHAPQLPLVSWSSRALSGVLLAAAALLPAACTFTIEERDEPDDVICPEYDVAPCADGTLPAMALDENGCEVPTCVACPPIEEPACAPGQWVDYQYDDAGCEFAVCSGTIGCPVYAEPRCPPNTVMQWTLDPSGCEIPECVPVDDCPALPLPSCGYGERLEFISNDCGCPEPTCVPDYGCQYDTGAADPAVDGGSGVSAPCACPPVLFAPCPEGTEEFASYDAYGCYVQECKPLRDCVVGGCSGQLCGEFSNDADLIGTCEWHDSYGCYQYGVCERQANGQCGWTASEELKECLAATGGVF